MCAFQKYFEICVNLVSANFHRPCLGRISQSVTKLYKYTIWVIYTVHVHQSELQFYLNEKGQQFLFYYTKNVAYQDCVHFIHLISYRIILPQYMHSLVHFNCIKHINDNISYSEITQHSSLNFKKKKKDENEFIE